MWSCDEEVIAAAAAADANGDIDIADDDDDDGGGGDDDDEEDKVDSGPLFEARECLNIYATGMGVRESKLATMVAARNKLLTEALLKGKRPEDVGVTNASVADKWLMEDHLRIPFVRR